MLASFQKRKNGSYLLVVEAGYDSHGKRVKHTKTVKDVGIRKVRQLLAEFQTEVESGGYISPEKMNFDAFIEEWQLKYGEQNLAPLTLKNYNHVITAHLLPVFRNYRLDQIKSLHIVTFLNDLTKPGARKDGTGNTLSSGTVEYIYRVLKNVITRAVDWQMINKHPMQSIKKPKVIHSTANFYDEEEAQMVIKALYTEPIMWRLFFIAALLGGFRRGELIALQWINVDFANNIINVERSISLTKHGEAIVKKPKTRASIRSVTMPDWFMREMKLYQKQWDLEKETVDSLWEGGNDEYVFHVGFGKPIFHSSPTHWWRRFTKRHNLKQVKLHSLRTSSASILLQNDVSMKAIQQRLGHSSYQTTADIYTIVAKSVSKSAADKLEKLDPNKRDPNLPPQT